MRVFANGANDLGVKTLQDVVALGKKQRLSYCSAGVGSQHHLAGELLKNRAGIDLLHVPYKGSAEAVTDLVGKRIDLLVGGISPSLPYVAAGQVTPIDITSETRSSKLPETPSFNEAGFPDYKVLFWAGIMASKDTPRTVIEKLNSTISEAMNSPEVLARLEKIGADPVNLGPDGFLRRITSDEKMWKELIDRTGLKIH